jgi:hypothetical protein
MESLVMQGKIAWREEEQCRNKNTIKESITVT